MDSWTKGCTGLSSGNDAPRLVKALVLFSLSQCGKNARETACIGYMADNGGNGSFGLAWGNGLTLQFVYALELGSNIHY